MCGRMSGAPVYVLDLDRVVGMTIAGWDGLKVKTGLSGQDKDWRRVWLSPAGFGVVPFDPSRILCKN